MHGWAFRKAHGWLLVMGTALFMLLGALFLSPSISREVWEQRNQRMSRMVQALYLTDLCLFTDGRFLRHLTQSDMHAPFQDNPAAFDYFPSGSLVPPPVPLWEATHALASDAD